MIYVVTTLRGIRGTPNDETEVDISPRHLIEATIELITNKYPQFKGGNYIDEHGYWQIFQYTHPHFGYDKFATGPLATPGEVSTQYHITFLEKLV